MDNNRLIAQLTDADEDVRAGALLELSERMDDDIARAFLDIAASDADQEIRAGTLVELGPVIEEAGIDYDDDIDFGFSPELGPSVSREMFDTIVREIHVLYEDEAQPRIVRRRALEVLVRDPQPWQMPAIRKHFTSEDPLWKVTAVFAMGYVTGFEKEIAATIASASDELLYEAVAAAGAMRVSATASRIRDLATSGSTDPELRLAAIEALPDVDPECGEILKALAKSKDVEIAATAEAALEDLSLDEDFGEYDDEEVEVEVEDEDRD
jgi:hypothetical protein